VSTQVQEKLPEPLQDALNKGLLKRLPITFLPFTRQQLRDWGYLFPYERRSILHLLPRGHSTRGEDGGARLAVLYR
jgi:hypothetical protein